VKPSSIPWTERARTSRAIADLCLGCYPRFCLGLGLSNRILPVFHFHDVRPEYLAPYLNHLQKGGYQTLDVETFLDVLFARRPIPDRAVFLTFDDAWTSIRTVAEPMLQERSQKAVTFAICGRVSKRPGLREQWDGKTSASDSRDRSEEPFARWDELRELEKAGTIEVETHTFAHEFIPCGPSRTAWTAEALTETPLLSRPVEKTESDIKPYDQSEAGRPRYPTRPRMSEVRAWLPEEDRHETPEEAEAAIRSDLLACRESFEKEMRRPTRLLCFPWTVAGPTARKIAAETGFTAAFSDYFPGRRYVRPGDNPFRLMRLKHQWILKLPT